MDEGSDQELDRPLTRRERKKLAKEEKEKNKEKQELFGKFKKLIIVVLILGVLGYFGYKIYNYFTAPLPEVAAQPIEINDSDWIEGPKEAQVTLLEYGDFQCPACGNYYPLVKKLHEEYPENLRVIFRNFPLVSIHPNAMTAAKAAEAAGKQGKFWEMHDKLFENQTDWSDERDPKDKFIGYANDIGLNEEQFVSDMDSSEVQDKINNDMLSGNTLGVNSTPTFYLNGKQVTPKSYDEFKSLVDGELNK
jgi:protein-disulfide isomerase